MSGTDSRPLIAHVVYRFDVGGLENGVINLINRLPADRFRHAVIALTRVMDFRERIERGDVEFVSLNKAPGHGIRLVPQFVRLFRRLRPSVVHSRNLAALEAAPAAWLAGVPVRLHGEHGWDVTDLDGRNLRNRVIRRVYRPFVSHYVTVSAHLARYLERRIGLGPDRVAQIYNGVDTQRFAPAEAPPRIDGCPFDPAQHRLVCAVGRLQPVKDHATLLRAFARALDLDAAADRLRLVLVGDGPLRDELQQLAASLRIAERVWFAGSRDDVADVLRGVHCFVLPSLAEGISNTLLEAMATALPVVATHVGGNVELVDHDATGTLVPAAQPESMARAIANYFRDPARARAHGGAARAAAVQRFSLARMVNEYATLYESLLDAASPRHRADPTVSSRVH